MRVRNRAVLAWVLGVIASLALGAAQAQQVKLTAATGMDPNIPTHWWFKEYIGPKLKEYSKGQIEPNVQVAAALCNEHACVEQVKLGQIDIGSVSAGNIGAFGTVFEILNLPYIFKDDDAAARLITGWLGKELAARAEKEMGLKVIAIIPSYSFRNVDNSKREIRVPSDMKGLKFRVTKSAVEFNLVKTWGGTPVPYDWGQLYQGLQSGIVDGMYIPDAYVAAMRFYEVTKFITHTGGGWNSHIIFMDAKRYAAMAKPVQEVIDRIGTEIYAQGFKVDNEWMERQTKALEGKVKVYKPNAKEIQAWYDGAPPAWLAVKGRYDPQLAKKVLLDQGQAELVKKLEKAGAL